MFTGAKLAKTSRHCLNQDRQGYQQVVGVRERQGMRQPNVYIEITEIRARLLDLIGEVSAASRRFDRNASVVQDELLMVSNNLGRIATRLADERTLTLVASGD